MLIRSILCFLFLSLQTGLFAQQYGLPVVSNLQAGLLDSSNAVITSNYYDGDNSGVWHHHVFFNAGPRVNLGFGLLSEDVIGKDLIYLEGYFNLSRTSSSSISFAFKALKIDGADDFLGFPELFGSFGSRNFSVTLGYSVAMNINEFDFENFATFDALHGFGGFRVDLLKSIGSGSLQLFCNNNITKVFYDDYLLFNKVGLQGEIKNFILRGGLQNFINLEDTDFNSTQFFVGAGYCFK